MVVTDQAKAVLHLQRIGLANQTTMLANESLAIGVRLQQAMVEKLGVDVENTAGVVFGVE